MINVSLQSTIFESNVPLALSLTFQGLCNIFLFLASTKDPGVFPTIEYSEQSPMSEIIDRKYLNIRSRDDRVHYLVPYGGSQYV